MEKCSLFRNSFQYVFVLNLNDETSGLFVQSDVDKRKNEEIYIAITITAECGLSIYIYQMHVFLKPVFFFISFVEFLIHLQFYYCYHFDLFFTSFFLYSI